MIKAILLDVDNTLLDFDAYVQEAMRSGFSKFNLAEYHDEMYQVFTKINVALWHDLELGLLTYEELLQIRWNKVFSALNISGDGPAFEQYFKGCLFDSAIPIQGAVDVLRYLKDRYILCVASNGPHEQQLNRLKKAGMLPFFSEVFTSGKIGFSKPSAQFFSHCTNRLNEISSQGEIHSSEIMMIGDSLTSDMTGAINSGMKTCFYDRNQSGRGNGLPIDYIIHDLSDILNIL